VLIKVSPAGLATINKAYKPLAWRFAIRRV
jgi:hypothetical protein